MNAQDEKFNLLTLFFAVIFIVSIFSRFTASAGIYSAVFFAVSIVFLFKFNKYSFDRTILLPAIFFIAAIIISYYASDFKYNARNNVLLFSSAAGLYALCGLLTQHDKKSVMLIPVLIALWLTIYLFATNFAFSKLLEPQSAQEYMRAVAGFLVAALCLSFVFWWTERKIYFYTSFIIFFAIIMTKSYFASAIASLAFASFLFFMREKIRVRAYLTLLPFLCVFAVCVYFLANSSFFQQKIICWQTALSVIKDNFWTGAGLGNYQIVSSAYVDWQTAALSQPENIFLLVFAEIGVAGFGAFALLIAMFFYFSFRRLKTGGDKTLYLPVLMAGSSFLTFAFFESCVLTSTNILLLFALLAFPLDFKEAVKRRRSVNSYFLIALILPLALSLGKPLYAQQQYKKGIAFFAVKKYTLSHDYFLSALDNDCLNPDYASKLSDNFFAVYSQNEREIDLNNAVEYAKYALSLNGYNAKYYYQLAWLYHFKNEKQKASDYISKAVEIDKYNKIYLDSYKELIY
ncbi:MAG: O-antigen ligase family protein [Endomicrobium sp.]|nr:O-antigen ligase family protein [Endomicrobium sp.]